MWPFVAKVNRAAFISLLLFALLRTHSIRMAANRHCVLCMKVPAIYCSDIDSASTLSYCSQSGTLAIHYRPVAKDREAVAAAVCSSDVFYDLH